MNDETKDCGSVDTMPRHHWLHNVTVAAVKRGADPEILRNEYCHAMLTRWYLAGEPIWMAVDGAVHLSKHYAIQESSEREIRFLRGMIRQGATGGAKRIKCKVHL